MIDIRVNYSTRDAVNRPFGADGVLAAMDKYGIDKAVLVPEMAVDSDFRRGNKELFDLIKGQDRLYGYLAVNPNYPEESIAIMRSAMSSPKFLAIALFGGASRPYPNLDDHGEMLNAYRRFMKPVFVHAPSAEAVAAVEEMAREFPMMKFILGSMGGSEWKRAMTLTQLLNVFAETSGSFDAEKIEEAVERLGPNRILFGSNLPAFDPACILALIRSSDIPESAVEKILSKNAEKLFNL
ncbi:MAG: amidohydrolase family protein [Armatimonadota bacterium]